MEGLMTEEKTPGQVCYEARWAGTPGVLWDDAGEEGRGDYERAAQAVVGAYRERARRALMGKSIGQVAYESHSPLGAWDDRDATTKEWWEAIGSAVADAVHEATGTKERKGKRLRELEARVEELEYWRNQGALR